MGAKRLTGYLWPPLEDQPLPLEPPQPRADDDPDELPIDPRL